VNTKKTLYLVRHAQSLPIAERGFAGWPLSELGVEQAERLADLLSTLGIEQVFSSPFTRTLDTARPFSKRQTLEITLVPDLRERLIVNDNCHPSDEVWRRSWEDFNFALPECEPSAAAQARICRAVADVARRTNRVSALFTHGNVIGLFLNALVPSYGRLEAEALTNPDVIKLECDGAAFMWDCQFRLAGLEKIATPHLSMPPGSNANFDALASTGFQLPKNRFESTA
jgi:2,3-bisphosphoglycerate-dependent phosphoglycerate mutase